MSTSKDVPPALVAIDQTVSNGMTESVGLVSKSVFLFPFLSGTAQPVATLRVGTFD